MIDPTGDLMKDSPKTPGSGLAWLGYAVGLIGLLIFGFAAVLLLIFALQATDAVERDTMFAFALVFALPATLICGLLAWGMKRIIRRQAKPAFRRQA